MVLAVPQLRRHGNPVNLLERKQVVVRDLFRARPPAHFQWTLRTLFGKSGLKCVVMPEIESGFRWWARYVLVPLIGGGGLIAIVVATIEREKGLQANPSVAVSAAPAGNHAANADQKLKGTAKKSRSAVPEQARQAVTMRSEYEELTKAISSGNETSVKAAGETLARILTKAKIQFDPGASASNLLEVFKQAIIAAADDDAKIKTLSEAVKSVASQ